MSSEGEVTLNQSITAAATIHMAAMKIIKRSSYLKCLVKLLPHFYILFIDHPSTFHS